MPVWIAGDASAPAWTVPDGWTLVVDDSFPEWAYEVWDGGCPDDVPLVGPADAFAGPITSGSG